MTTPLGVALVGCGTVGTGVARLLLGQGPRLAARAGRPIVLRHVVVRHLGKPRKVELPPGVLTDNLGRVLDDPDVHVAAELIGGTEPARQIILELLAAGKDVVTANKAVLAHHAGELFRAAHHHGRTVAFEASVAGGIPIIGALAQGLAANQVLSLKAILNGTSNYILSQMTEHGKTYERALADAQRKGYAEADPTLDVDGTDAAHKLAILARIAFGVDVPVGAIERRGLEAVHASDLLYAGELGYVIKLLAEAWLDERQLALHVEPTLLRKLDPLAEVRGAYNAVHVVGDAVGDTLYYGLGAGQMPTASAVVADVLDLAIGRAQATFQSLRLWEPDERITLRSSAGIQSRFYLRMNVEDRPGVLAEVAGILAQHRVSIASLMQHEAADDDCGAMVPLVLMTHNAAIGAVRQALARIDRLDCVAGPSAYFPVAE